MSRRTLRVASLIRSIVAEAIMVRLSDPRIEPMTSVTRVEVTPDLLIARVYLSVMASAARRELCLEAIRSASGRLRAAVAEQVALRRVPQLEFRLDESVRGSCETVMLIDHLMDELAEHQPPAPDEHGQENADPRATPSDRGDETNDDGAMDAPLRARSRTRPDARSSE